MLSLKQRTSADQFETLKP